ncbi:MAG: glycosyltransferase family 9 protein [Desulfosoma sp.]
MFHEHSSIGFWHNGALGDFVLFSAVLDAFHEVQPEASFVLWTRPAHGDLLCGKPYGVTVASVEDPFWRALFTDEAWRTAPVPQSLSQCGLFFWVGQKSARSAVERLKERLSCPVFWIQSFTDGSVREGVTRFLVGQLSALGFSVPERPPSFAADTAAVSQVQAWLCPFGLRFGSYAVVHVGSGGLGKVWPVARWRALFEETEGFFGVPTVLLSGPADEALAPFVAKCSATWGWPVYQSGDLRELAALLSGAVFFMGCDSGVSHVAAAMKVPGLVIFGPTDPAVWAPIGEHVTIYKDSWDPQEVLEEGADPARGVDEALVKRLREILLHRSH